MYPQRPKEGRRQIQREGRTGERERKKLRFRNRGSQGESQRKGDKVPERWCCSQMWRLQWCMTYYSEFTKSKLSIRTGLIAAVLWGNISFKAVVLAGLPKFFILCFYIVHTPNFAYYVVVIKHHDWRHLKGEFTLDLRCTYGIEFNMTGRHRSNQQAWQLEQETKCSHFQLQAGSKESKLKYDKAISSQRIFRSPEAGVMGSY